ncbi:MAG: polysaccharide biosynthesis C-terminal domain-containing protein, partial [Clostridium sp.]
MCLLNGFAIKKYLHYKQEIVKTFLLPTLAAAFMGAAAFITYKGIHLLTHSNIIGTIMALLIAVAVYGTLLIKLRCVEEKELYTMPGGKKIIKIARQMRLL